jgi:DNA ligase D-like protein (predicted polymerase)/DNA ligase D-like protein (predicted 3'-phosphoesterase)
MGLETYRQKRDFEQTPEPYGKLSPANRYRFVVQEHHASKLHFDFRLEMGGVLKSWSIPKGPSLDPGDKRFAVPTEDHPVEYLKFAGHIPEGNYGAGEHMIWDTGTYQLLEGTDPLQQLEDGRLSFLLKGEKLQGAFNLIRMREGQWLLIKSRDEYAKKGWRLELLVEVDGWNNNQARETGRGKQQHVPATKVKKYSAKPDGKIILANRAFQTKDLAGSMHIKVGTDIVAVSSLDKVYWPEDGYTKGDLLAYYYDIAKIILPYLKERPLIMKRYPNGIEGSYFHQHDIDEAPEYVHTASLKVEEDGGHIVDYIIGDNLATLLYMTNIGAIERHPWHSRIDNLDCPDWIVFDLDPGEGISYSTICELAVKVNEFLESIKLECYAKTSGSRGMHVYLPIRPVYGYEEIAVFAEQVATWIANENQKIATVERSLKKRKKGQIYLDHMQNARGKSVVAPYSVRPRPGATVSAPLEWDEVRSKKIAPLDFTIKTIAERLAKKGDLFKPVLRKKQNLRAAIEKMHDLFHKPYGKGAKA